MKYSDILETRLSRLSPQERKRVEAVARHLAKARLANMLDQSSSLTSQTASKKPSSGRQR